MQKIYVAENANCLNCGATENEVKQVQRKLFLGTAGILLLMLLAVALLFTLPFGLGSLLNDRIFNKIGWLPVIALILNVAAIALIIIGNIVFQLNVFKLLKEDEADADEFVSKYFSESLTSWEQQVGAKKENLAEQLNDMQAHKHNILPSSQESESFDRAENLLIEKQKSTEIIFNAFGVMRWLNEAEYIFFLAQSADDNSDIDLLLTKINVTLPKGRTLNNLRMEKTVENSLNAALDKLDRLKSELHRRKSLNFIQSVRAEAEPPEEYEERLLNQSARLILAEGSLQGITADMFLKEKYRLEILDILK